MRRRLLLGAATMALPAITVTVTVASLARNVTRELTTPNAVEVRAALTPIADRSSDLSLPAIPAPTTTTTTAPPPPPPPPPPTTTPPDPLERVTATLDETIPQHWRSAVPVRITLIDGATSWATTDGSIRVSRYHANGTASHLRAVLAHEWGHLAAYRFGSRRYLGAPPDGFPENGGNTAEAWAGCMSHVLTGDGVDPASRCDGDQLSFTASWIAAGPPG